MRELPDNSGFVPDDAHPRYHGERALELALIAGVIAVPVAIYWLFKLYLG